VILLKDLQHSKMREVARESATQGQRDAGFGGVANFRGFAIFDHDASLAIATAFTQWAERPEFLVPMVMFQKRTKAMP
jgi:hypothetical protein